MTIVWTIAGSDSGGGAGVQADLITCHDFNVHACTAITALTAQNTCGVSHIQPTSRENLAAQLVALSEDLPPSAIKLGMLFDRDLILCTAEHLRKINAPIIADPVLISTSGCALSSQDFIQDYKKHILPLATLLTPNIHEAQALTDHSISTHEDMARAAADLLKQGAQAVLIKGGDLSHPTLASDYYADHHHSFWINQNRIPGKNTHGTGCTLSTAIAASVTLGWSLIDAIIIAKAYVHAGLSSPVQVGSKHSPIGHGGISHLREHFPWVTEHPALLPDPFKIIERPIGRYPIVDNLDDLKLLCSKGISFIQLRIKTPGDDFELICQQAETISQSFGVTLILNDHLSQGTHLGQEDLDTVSLNHSNRSSMTLGISAHNLYELAKGYAHHPSYLAMGPIFKSSSKHLNYPDIGLDKLRFIASLCPLPLVAIGGVDFDQIPDLLSMGCSGVAFIAASKQLIQDGRFDRHYSLPSFDLLSQQRLSKSKIVCIGAGGLAAGFLPYLVAAGVGEITLIDNDRVSYSNLQRQILFREADMGQLKVEAASRYLSALNSKTKINTHALKLTIDNAIELLSSHDLIIDGTDNFDSHYLINDMSRFLRTHLIAASVYQDQGQLFYLSARSACYRCLFPTPPSMHERPNCSTAGVLGTTPGTMGIMQAQLAINLLSRSNPPEQSFCRTVNMNTWQVKNFPLDIASNCPVCHTDLSFNSLRSKHMSTAIEEISAEALKQAIEAGETIHLLDVREEDEREEFNIGGAHIPIQDLPERIFELDSSLPYVVYCRSGGRSGMACKFLAGQGFKVKNLSGGMLAWQAL